MSDVKLYRYAIPHVKHEGWAEVVIGSNGYFSTVSDYGDYAFRWTHFGERDFREFFIHLNADYVHHKLDPSTVFDVDSSVANARYAICLARRLQVKGYEIDADAARRAYDEAAHINDEIELHEWFKDWGSYIDDPCSISCYMPPAQILAFVEKTLPRIQQAIREELFKEGNLK
jgi:hypothetical protein